MSSCANEATDDDHGHGHSHGGGGHAHSHEPEDGSGNSLFGYIDRDSVVALNESEEDTGKNCIKPWDLRLDDTLFVQSDEDDAELIIRVPFSVAVKVRSFCVVGGANGMAPSHVKLYVNRDDIDFATAEDLPPIQEFDLVEDYEAEVDYPVKASKFQNITSITLFFTASHGNPRSQISYLGFKGEGTEARRGVVECTYEASAQLKDHMSTKADGFTPSELS